jgi:nucleoside-diphosphate-sugar epimerase
MSAALALKSTRREIIDASLASVLGRLQREPLAGKNIFMTGGTGFFGLWLLSAIALLNEQGAGIRVTLLSRRPAAFLEAHPRWRNAPWMTPCAGNVRDFNEPHARFDMVIHAATETSAAAHADHARMFEDIAAGSSRVLDFADAAGATRILLVSSGAVYGAFASDVECVAETAGLPEPTHLPEHAYAEGKRQMESMAQSRFAQGGIEPVIARCFAFSGPGLPLDGHYAVGNFVRDALFADAIVVKGDGTAVRSYLDGADLAIWLLQLLGCGQPGQAYNVGSDAAISIRDLATRVQELLAPGKEVRLQGGVASSGGPRQRYVPSIALARRAMGLDVWTPLNDSIRAMASYAKAK